jgi:hypothetical protein
MNIFFEEFDKLSKKDLTRKQKLDRSQKKKEIFIKD